MHGTIFMELRKYVECMLGTGAWPGLLKDSGLESKVYLAVREYPDEEAAAIMRAASAGRKVSLPDLQEDFGMFIAPDLIGMYSSFVKPEWRTLDLIEHTESTIHRVVRLRNPGAQPPELRTRRPSADTVEITYTSPRRLCAVARGIIKGLAFHYNEQVEIREARCMNRGDPSCELTVRSVG